MHTFKSAAKADHFRDATKMLGKRQRTQALLQLCQCLIVHGAGSLSVKGS